MKKIRILIADDHALMRLGLKSMISLQRDMEVVGEAENGQEAIDLALALAPDVIILDLMMPKVNGAAATKAICDARPDANVILLTSYGDAAVLMKDAPTESLLTAIRSVMSGGMALTAEFVAPCEAALPALTPRQTRILESVALGYTNKDIALQLGITEIGVKKHLRLVFAKLGVANRTEAVALALKRQILRK